LRVRELPGKPQTVDACLAQEWVTADGEVSAHFRLQPASGFPKPLRHAGRRPRERAETSFRHAPKSNLLMAHCALPRDAGRGSVQATYDVANVRNEADIPS